jgi:hypothetical protein
VAVWDWILEAEREDRIGDRSVWSVGLGGAGRGRKGGRDGLAVGCLLHYMGHATVAVDCWVRK